MRKPSLAAAEVIQLKKEQDPVSTDITWHRGKVSREERVRKLGQDAATIWLTGLSGSGKSTLAFELERRLLDLGYVAYVLDGDNVRHGLSRDLGFSPDDRAENIRRIAEVAKLFNDAGIVLITAFISPYREDRDLAREIVGAHRFVETHLAADIAVCESRDPKGLYKKARAGELPGFTGISAPYEPPLSPEIRIDTGELSIEESIDRLVRHTLPRLGNFNSPL
ncbi:MAG: adenylyl-sulfate kinase [Rhodocyclaceae bacterium]